MNNVNPSTKYTLNIDDKKLDTHISKIKDNLDKEIEKFNEKHRKFKIDRQGNEENITNPYLVSTYFFKSINPMESAEPTYTVLQLTKVWKIYMYIVEKINMDVVLFQPTLSHFASFCGLPLEKLQSLKNDPNESMRLLINRINDEIFNANMTLTQQKYLTERPTTYRMKVENEALEKKSPNVNINIGTKAIDLNAMQERLKNIRAVANGQIEYEGK